MSAGRVIAYIAAAIVIFFGVLFIWGSFSAQGQTGWILIGILSVGIGFGLIFLASRQAAKTGDANVTLKVDLSGDIKLSEIKCRSCGGTLSAENIKMVAGAPVVNCPYCHTSYQITEEPKW